MIINNKEYDLVESKKQQDRNQAHFQNILQIEKELQKEINLYAESRKSIDNKFEDVSNQLKSLLSEKDTRKLINEAHIVLSTINSVQDMIK